LRIISKASVKECDHPTSTNHWRLDPARTRLISGFVDTYLRLNVQEEQVFQGEVGTLEATEREGIMRESVIYQEILQEGEQVGEQRGKTEGEQSGAINEARSLILRQLARRVGTLPATVEAQVQALALPQLEALGEALLDFAALDDLTKWLLRIS
jgi:flagellar biosynthesis/type III secretory pathway protein FliH